MTDFGFTSDEPDLNRKMIQVCESELRAREESMLKQYVIEKKSKERIEFTIYETWMQ